MPLSRSLYAWVALTLRLVLREARAVELQRAPSR
jgi:hypothetical protein